MTQSQLEEFDISMYDVMMCTARVIVEISREKKYV